MKRSRRTFIADFKAKVAIEAIKKVKNTSELSQIYLTHPNLISLGKRAFQQNVAKFFDSGKEEQIKSESLRTEKEEIIQQGCQLTVDNTWFKIGSMIPLEIRRELIEFGDSKMSICKQCELLSVA